MNDIHVAKNISRRCDWYEIKIVRETRKGAKIGAHLNATMVRKLVSSGTLFHTPFYDKNSSVDEIENVNLYAVHPEDIRIR